MEENNTTTANPGAGRGLGIAGMILGIVAIIVSFIPCFGWWAMVMAVVGLILSAISLSQAKKAKASTGMALTGLICSIVAIIIVIVWVALFAKGVGMVKDELDKTGALDSLSKAMEQLKDITDTLKTH
jgi:hypothetical protein